MVERVDVNSVLMQMRQVKNTLRAQHAANNQALVNNANSVTNTLTSVNGSSSVGSVNQATRPINSQFEQVLQRQVDTPTSGDHRLQPLPLNNDVTQSTTAPNQVTQTATDNTVPEFQTMFSNAVNTVNSNQKVAAELARRFEQGDASIDLPEVMIALQKSSVSFQAMTQVRNKLVEAYKDIMNMPV